MKKKMTEFISFRVSPEVLRKLSEICEHNQESRSQVLIGLIIAEYARLAWTKPNFCPENNLVYEIKEEKQDEI